MTTEYNLCPTCGGVKGPVWPRTYGPCRCADGPMPVSKHDGKLDKDGDAKVQYGAAYPGEEGVYVIDVSHDAVYLNPSQALSLLAWLQQEEAKLHRLAKEQE